MHPIMSVKKIQDQFGFLNNTICYQYIIVFADERWLLTFNKEEVVDKLTSKLLR